MSLDTWHRQERAFGLLTKVYAKRAKLRGEQPPIATTPMTLPEPGSGNDPRAIAGLLRLGAFQLGRRLLAMLALFSETG
jgi:hypothetical protein